MPETTGRPGGPEADPVSGRESIVAPRRADRPHHPDEARCPFCPGNEALLAEIVWEETAPDGGWRTRGVPNRYPIVVPPNGWHEVVIDTPRHAPAAGSLTEDEWIAMTGSWRTRVDRLSARWKSVTLFRNQGSEAGRSIEHPHSQIVCLARLPRRIRAARARLRRAHAQSGGCMLCHAIEAAREEGRMVAEHDSMAAFVPARPQVSCELCIAPTDHRSVFGETGVEAAAALAGILRRIERTLTGALGDIPYNLILENDSRTATPWLHWYFRLRPGNGRIGGFERATGIAVTATSAADDAARLRAALDTL